MNCTCQLSISGNLLSKNEGKTFMVSLTTQRNEHSMTAFLIEEISKIRHMFEKKGREWTLQREKKLLLWGP